jgi:hypothetical protein
MISDSWQTNGYAARSQKSVVIVDNAGYVAIVELL